MIERQPDMRVVVEVGDGQVAIERARKVRPDVVIVDIGMPTLNGIEATRQIVKLCPNVSVIALSMHRSIHFVTEMLQAGARGYLLKDCAFEELVGAIRVVLNNEMYLSPSVASLVVRDYLRHEPGWDRGLYSLLTARERQVLQLLTEGKTTKEVASQLEVSVKTVETHRQSLMSKLNTKSIAELTKLAVREGLTSLDT